MRIATRKQKLMELRQDIFKTRHLALKRYPQLICGQSKRSVLYKYDKPTTNKKARKNRPENLRHDHRNRIKTPKRIN